VRVEDVVEQQSQKAGQRMKRLGKGLMSIKDVRIKYLNINPLHQQKVGTASTPCLCGHTIIFEKSLDFTTKTSDVRPSSSEEPPPMYVKISAIPS